MNRRIISVLFIIALALAGTSVDAYVFGGKDVIVESWSGSGANKALCVIDFGPASFAFGYRFDGSKTGWDMLSTIAGQTALDIVDDTSYGGHLINTFGYDGYYLSYDSENWSDTQWWEYWTSPDGEAWTSSMVGCGGRALSDGAWDGWTWSPVWPEVGAAPDVPLVPEPSSIMAILSLIGLAGSSMLLRKRG